MQIDRPSNREFIRRGGKNATTDHSLRGNHFRRRFNPAAQRHLTALATPGLDSKWVGTVGAVLSQGDYQRIRYYLRFRFLANTVEGPYAFFYQPQDESKWFWYLMRPEDMDPIPRPLGIVYLNGGVIGDASISSHIGTLPEGYRPETIIQSRMTSWFPHNSLPLTRTLYVLPTGELHIGATLLEAGPLASGEFHSVQWVRFGQGGSWVAPGINTNSNCVGPFEFARFEHEVAIRGNVVGNFNIRSDQPIHIGTLPQELYPSESIEVPIFVHFTGISTADTIRALRILTNGHVLLGKSIFDTVNAAAPVVSSLNSCNHTSIVFSRLPRRITSTNRIWLSFVAADPNWQSIVDQDVFWQFLPLAEGFRAEHPQDIQFVMV